MTLVVWALAAVLSGGATDATAAQAQKAAEAPQATSAETLARHAGKAGFYLRLPKQQRERDPDFYLSHPLVDAVVISFGWSDIEPRPGEFNFTEIDKFIALCKKHQKGLVLAFSTYGQHPDINLQPTPTWLYDKGVERITFHGGGAAKGKGVVIPKVWDDAYWPWYEKFVKKLGERYRDEKAIWYVMPAFGHIGNLNAQPSKGGGPALLKAGWTAEKREAFCLKVAALYQKEFPATPLIVTAANQLLQDKGAGTSLEDRHHRNELMDILTRLAGQGISIIRFGLEVDENRVKKSKLLEQYRPLVPLAEKGLIRLGIGDDWPLWVPANRRGVKFLADRDEKGLRSILDNAFGGVHGLPETRVSILYVLHPEIEAPHPGRPDGQNKEVYELLKAARERLIRDDPVKKPRPLRTGRKAVSHWELSGNRWGNTVGM